MQPTKLPDDLFSDDEWQAADYAARVALLVMRYVELVSTRQQMRDAIADMGTELCSVRGVNAGLVLEIEKLTTGQ